MLLTNGFYNTKRKLFQMLSRTSYKNASEINTYVKCGFLNKINLFQKIVRSVKCFELFVSYEENYVPWAHSHPSGDEAFV